MAASAAGCQLGAARAGWEVRLYERAAAFSSARVCSWGPTPRRLQAWGLQNRCRQWPPSSRPAAGAQRPPRGHAGHPALGAEMVARYGAAHATIHRADLHGLLHGAVRDCATVQLHLGRAIAQHAESEGAIQVRLADGKGSRGRCPGRAPTACGAAPARNCWAMARHAPPDTWPTAPWCRRPPCRSRCAAPRSPPGWGRACIAVHYPVRRGELLNLVVIVHARHRKIWRLGPCRQCR